jgi:DNA-binding NarL/FixJ family response regulator
MVLDVIQHHQFTLIRRRGKWERLERAELKRLQDEIQRLNGELQRHLLNHHPDTPIPETGVPIGEKLSAREQELLRLLVLGQTNKDIAKTLALSVRTVERYRSTLMKKLGLQNTTELIIYAVTHGFLKE